MQDVLDIVKCVLMELKMRDHSSFPQGNMRRAGLEGLEMLNACTAAHAHRSSGIFGVLGIVVHCIVLVVVLAWLLSKERGRDVDGVIGAERGSEGRAGVVPIRTTQAKVQRQRQRHRPRY